MEVQGHPDDVSLLVRLWVEMSWAFSWGSVLSRQPPCEAVSWNVHHVLVHGLSDAVSLLVRLWVEMPSILPFGDAMSVSLLVRLWVEISTYGATGASAIRQPPCEAVSWNGIISSDRSQRLVSLLVRLWVEIDWDSRKSPHIAVSLLVRLWVEIDPVSFQDLGTTSASLWGCELKCQYLGVSTPDARQPPCEAVSWNVRLLEHIPAS